MQHALVAQHPSKRVKVRRYQDIEAAVESLSVQGAN